MWKTLQKKTSLFLTLPEIAFCLGLPIPSARVSCSRKTKSGDLLRAKRNFYLLPERFDTYGEKELMLLANFLQTPSYISFLTALSFHGVTTQIASDWIESANGVRSVTYKIKTVSFRYYYCRPDFYFGYERQDGVFIATPEKALLDALYLVSLGRYAVDESALDLKGIAWSRVTPWLRKYPERFKIFLKSWRTHYENPRAA